MCASSLAVNDIRLRVTALTFAEVVLSEYISELIESLIEMALLHSAPNLYRSSREFRKLLAASRSHSDISITERERLLWQLRERNDDDPLSVPPRELRGHREQLENPS